MKIKVFDSIIDIDKIYSISNIIPPSTKSFDDSDCSSDNEVDWMYRFYIRLIDGQQLQFLDANFGRQKIEQAREFILKYWTKEQSLIPEFK